MCHATGRHSGGMVVRVLLALALLAVVRQTAGRSKGQPMVSGTAEAPESRSCADIVGASAASCPRTVAQAMSVAELQRVCDLKMVSLSTVQVVQQARLPISDLYMRCSAEYLAMSSSFAYYLTTCR